MFPPDCAICFSSFSSTTYYVEGQWCQQAVGHFFHTSCIRDWLARASTCPMCRKELSSHRLVILSNPRCSKWHTFLYQIMKIGALCGSSYLLTHAIKKFTGHQTSSTLIDISLVLASRNFSFFPSLHDTNRYIEETQDTLPLYINSLAATALGAVVFLTNPQTLSPLPVITATAALFEMRISHAFSFPEHQKHVENVEPSFPKRTPPLSTQMALTVGFLTGGAWGWNYTPTSSLALRITTAATCAFLSLITNASLISICMLADQATTYSSPRVIPSGLTSHTVSAYEGLLVSFY